MGGVQVSTTPNAAGVCEQEISMYVIDNAFHSLTDIGTSDPPALCASNGDLNKMCAYENLRVRLSSSSLLLTIRCPNMLQKG